MATTTFLWRNHLFNKQTEQVKLNIWQTDKNLPPHDYGPTWLWSSKQDKDYNHWNEMLWFKLISQKLRILIRHDNSRPNPGQSEKINLNLYFHTS